MTTKIKSLPPETAETSLWLKEGKFYKQVRMKLTAASLQVKMSEKNCREKLLQRKKLALGLHTRTQRVEAGSAAGAETQSTRPTSMTHTDAHTHTHTRVHTHTFTHPCSTRAFGEETKLVQTVNHLSWRGKMRFFFSAVLLIKS